MSGMAVARGKGTDSVLSNTGILSNCAQPVVVATDECSDDVFVNGIGVVREGDKVVKHKKRGCDDDTSVLNKFLSSTVYVNEKKLGRNGSKYTSGTEKNVITSGSRNVFTAY